MIASTVGECLQFPPVQCKSFDRSVGDAAHELNNLLTAVVGFAELALGQLGESHPAAASLGEILDASEKAGALARMLRDLESPLQEHSQESPSLALETADARLPRRASTGVVGTASPAPKSSSGLAGAGPATAHEVSNLLTTIALLSALCLKKLAAEDPMRGDLRDILGASEKAVALVEAGA